MAQRTKHLTKMAKHRLNPNLPYMKPASKEKVIGVPNLPKHPDYQPRRWGKGFTKGHFEAAGKTPQMDRWLKPVGQAANTSSRLQRPREGGIRLRGSMKERFEKRYTGTSSVSEVVRYEMEENVVQPGEEPKLKYDPEIAEKLLQNGIPDMLETEWKIREELKEMLRKHIQHKEQSHPNKVSTPKAEAKGKGRAAEDVDYVSIIQTAKKHSLEKDRIRAEKVEMGWEKRLSALQMPVWQVLKMTMDYGVYVLLGAALFLSLLWAKSFVPKVQSQGVAETIRTEMASVYIPGVGDAEKLTTALGAAAGKENVGSELIEPSSSRGLGRLGFLERAAEIERRVSLYLAGKLLNAVRSYSPEQKEDVESQESEEAIDAVAPPSTQHSTAEKEAVAAAVAAAEAAAAEDVL